MLLPVRFLLVLLVLIACPIVAGGESGKSGDKARQDLDDAVKRDPTSREPYFRRAAWHQNADRIDEAITDYTEALRIGPPDKVALTMRGRCYALKNDANHALADYAAALNLDPNYIIAHVGRSEVYKDQREFAKELADLNEAHRLMPKNVTIITFRAICYKHLEDAANAIADYTEAIQLTPGDANLYLARGGCYGVAGDMDKALADFNTYIAAAPKNIDGYGLRAKVYAAKGEHAKALADRTKAIDLEPDNPDNAENYIERGIANSIENGSDYASALADFKRVVKFKPKSADAYYYLAVILSACTDAKYRDGKAAVEYATKASELSKGNSPQASEALAAAYAENGQFDLAIETEKKVIARMPETEKELLDDMRKKLTLYENHKPWRREPNTPGPAPKSKDNGGHLSPSPFGPK